MKLREKIKRFWALDVHNREGFTLVELIIVIAILAILSSVAVVGYSSYVEKANKQADKTLAAEIVNALTLAYYSGELNGNGYVILSNTEGPDYGSNAEIKAALEATYGVNGVSSLKLKHNDWNIEYTNSSFAGDEIELLEKVDDLTGILGSVLDQYPQLMGANFQAYLAKLGLDPANPDDDTAISQAAVLYVAQNMGNANKTAWVDSVANLPTSGLSTSDQVCIAWLPYFNNSYLDVAAALYATAEAYCRYELNVHGKSEPMAKLDEGMAKIKPEEITDGKLAVQQVFSAFAAVQQLVIVDQSTAADYHFMEYFNNGQARKDAEAYVGILGTVSSAESAIVGSLGQENCFSSEELSNMFEVYSNGGVIIVVEILNDGTLKIANPLE